MTNPTSPDRSVSDDALASGGPAGDGGFDASRPFTTRDGRTVSNRFIDKYRPDLIFGTVDGVGGAWKRSTGVYEGRKSAVNPALDLINTPIPTVPPTPAGDLAGEDDAFLDTMAKRYGPDHPRDDIVRLIRLAREGARREPVAGDGWQPIETAPKDGRKVWLAVYDHKSAVKGHWTNQCASGPAGWFSGGVIPVGRIYAWRAVEPVPKTPSTFSSGAGLGTTVTPLEEAMCRTFMRLEGKAAYADRTGDFYDCGLDKSLPAWMAKLWWVREFLAAHPVLAASPDGAGSGSEPVAWQIAGWRELFSTKANAKRYADLCGLSDLVRPLYAAPPASVDAVAVLTELRDKWRDNATRCEGNNYNLWSSYSRAADEILFLLKKEEVQG